MSKSPFFYIAFLLVAMTQLMAVETPAKKLEPLLQQMPPKQSFAQRLNLNKEQREKWNAINQQYKTKEMELNAGFRQKVNALLTPEQKTLMKNAAQSRSKEAKKSPRGAKQTALDDLNLTKAQEESWMALFQEHKKLAVALLRKRSEEIDAILTYEQRMLIQQENAKREQAFKQNIMMQQAGQEPKKK